MARLIETGHALHAPIQSPYSHRGYRCHGNHSALATITMAAAVIPTGIDYVLSKKFGIINLRYI